ncbi:MAG: SUMF1/EgtB/PvdO family nonheme iron enzyme [Polyangiaceae bacterium]|nr:SUMF1/EgtB/PvdO family nonheme iron enzyme [Polyangiaceae bacterium]
MAVASTGACAAGAHDGSAVGRQRAPIAHAPAIVEVTEPDATVALASLNSLVISAGPSTLFAPPATVRCPHDMALVGDRVCVDKWEGSISVLVNGKEQLSSPFETLDARSPGSYRAVSRAGVVPQGYISGKQAEQACRSAGKRLCTTTEWELGCRGPSHKQFPYGNERKASVCNDDLRARHPVMEAAALAGVSRNVWLDGMNLAAINQLPDTLAKTGQREACVSDEGVFDMVGNLHEWVADADGTFRGGYYMDTTRNGDGCSYRTTAHDFEYHDYSTGFRCCADPETIE